MIHRTLSRSETDVQKSSKLENLENLNLLLIFTWSPRAAATKPFFRPESRQPQFSKFQFYKISKFEIRPIGRNKPPVCDTPILLVTHDF